MTDAPTLTAFEQHPTWGGVAGTASFAVGGFDLHVVWRLDPTGGLEVDAVRGSAQSLYGGDMPLTRQVADAILAAITTT